MENPVSTGFNVDFVFLPTRNKLGRLSTAKNYCPAYFFTRAGAYLYGAPYCAPLDGDVPGVTNKY